MEKFFLGSDEKPELLGVSVGVEFRPFNVNIISNAIQIS